MLRGFGEWLEEDPRGRLCMLNWRNYTRNWHDWNPMPEWSWKVWGGGGSYFWKGGSGKGGFGRTPRTPSGYGPVSPYHLSYLHHNLDNHSN